MSFLLTVGYGLQCFGADRFTFVYRQFPLRRSQIDLLLSFAPPALLALEPPDVLTC